MPFQAEISVQALPRVSTEPVFETDEAEFLRRGAPEAMKPPSRESGFESLAGDLLHLLELEFDRCFAAENRDADLETRTLAVDFLHFALE